MPIRPENLNRYPADWKQIRRRILTRAKDRCEWCGVRNGAIGVRDSKGVFCEMGMAESDVPHHGQKVIKIVLTIAHIDHTPENCDDGNLAATCQKCHNRHDAIDRLKNRRIRAMGTPDLFLAT